MEQPELLRERANTGITLTKTIPVKLLKSSRYQVRDNAFFSRVELENLANSIRSIGLIEYPKVRPCPEDHEYFEIITGHRRIRAVSEVLGWKEVTCEVHESEDESLVFQLSLEENIQRQNLSPYEEGVAFLLCEKMFGLSQDQVAERFHQSRSTVQTKRQLALSVNLYLKNTEPAYANAFLRHVTSGHLVSLARLKTEHLEDALRMIARGASPRHLERYASLLANTDENSFRGENQTSELMCEVSEVGSESHTNNNEERFLHDLDKLIEDSPSRVVQKLVEIRASILEGDKKSVVVSEGKKDGYKEWICCPKCGNRFNAL